MPMIQNNTLFEDIKLPTLSIREAAERINVSTATIRNWIKTGNLTLSGTAKVDLRSFESFRNDMSINGRLVARANKLCKTPHNHSEVSERILQGLSSGTFSPETVGMQYEELLSDSYRNKEGVYYTPNHIVSDMFLSLAGSNLSEKTFCDPCCGSGNFIIQALEHGFHPNNIYGFDIDPVAVAITKKRVFEKTGFISDNIHQIDFFDFSLTNQCQKFDNIFTNPPWGKKIPKQQRDLLGSAFGAGKSIDTCSLFFFACLHVLQDKGKLGLLLPESFFNIAVFEDARVKALSLHLERLVDYGKPFKGLITKAGGLILTNTSKSRDADDVSCEVNKTNMYRSTISFLKNPKSILNFKCPPKSASVIKHIYSFKHCYLHGQAKWGLGIVTGNNKKFCKKHSEEGYMPVFKGADISKGELNSPSYYIPEDLSLYQQVAPREIFLAKEKLIYKFISSNLCFFCDDQQHFVLNSANMLIPNSNFPITGRQLCDLLNSEVLNWVFKEIFNTHKILRSDIEVLPIHHAYFDEHDIFSEDTYWDYLNIERCSDGTFRIKE